MKKIIYLLSFIMLLNACKKDDVNRIVAKSLTISPSELELVEGGVKELSFEILPNDTNDKNLRWSSSDEDVATVSQGVVTAIKEGKADIVAETANGIKSVCKLSVVKNLILAEIISFKSPTIDIKAGDKLALVVDFIPTNTSDKTIVWTSSDEEIATISKNGVLQAIKPGKLTVMAKTANGKTAELGVNVGESAEYQDRMKEKELTNILMNADFGWLSSSVIEEGVKHNRYLEMTFAAAGKAMIATESTTPKASNYAFKVKGDNITLTLTTFAGFVEPRIILNPAEPMGPMYAMDLTVKEYSADKLVLSFNKGFERKLVFTKQTKAADFSKQHAIRKKLADGRMAILKDFASKNPACNPYLTLCITKGIDGASVKNPVKAGFFYSSMTSTIDITYNNDKDFFKYCGILVFTETGFVSGIPVEIGGKYISTFKYDEASGSFIVDEEGVEGHFECFNLPQYAVKGTCDNFLDHYSLFMRNFYPSTFLDEMKRIKNATYNSETKLKLVDMYLVTKYQKREPILNADGTFKIGEDNKWDYTKGELLGEGLLFAFEYYYQFYYYFVPLNADKLSEDRIRFSRKGETVCNTKFEGDAKIVKAAYDKNPTIQAFIDKMCDEQGLLIVKSEMEGTFDFDFRFIKTPEQWFIARNQ